MITQDFINGRRQSLDAQQAEAQAAFETSRALLQAIHGALQELDVVQSEFNKESKDGDEEVPEVRQGDEAGAQVPLTRFVPAQNDRPAYLAEVPQ